MTTGAREEGSNRPSNRWQISLADLIVLVLAVGVSAGIARGARDAWGSRLIPPAVAPRGAARTVAWTSSPVPLERTAGVIFEVAAVFVILNLARTLIALFRSWRGGADAQITSIVWPAAWRVGAIFILLSFVADQSGVLRLNFAEEMELLSGRPEWGTNYRLRQNLLPVYGALAITGLALGMGAGAVFYEPRPRRNRPYWLFVPLVGVIAVLLVAQSYHSLIAYLVLLAFEAVTNAMHHVSHEGPGFAARLLHTGPDATIAFTACLALALVVARDFDRAYRRQPWATTRARGFLRLLALLVTLGTGIYVARVTIPEIHPCLFDGFIQVLTPGVIFATAGGFGLFSLGLAARAVAPRQNLEKPRWLILGAASFRYGFLLVLGLAALKGLPGSSQLSPALPPVVGRVLDVLGKGQAWVWGLFPYPLVVVLNYCLETETLKWLIGVIFVLGLVLELTISRTNARVAPFDAAFASPRSAVEVAWLSVALTVLCLVALPVLLVGGLVILHIHINLEDWLSNGWPR